jgi:hypothetical protein
LQVKSKIAQDWRNSKIFLPSALHPEDAFETNSSTMPFMGALMQRSKGDLHTGPTLPALGCPLPYLDLDMAELNRPNGLSAIDRLHTFPPAQLRLELTAPWHNDRLELTAQVKPLGATLARNGAYKYAALNLGAAEFSIHLVRKAAPHILVSRGILTEDFKAAPETIADLLVVGAGHEHSFNADSTLLMEPSKRYVFVNDVKRPELPREIDTSLSLEAAYRYFFREYVAAYGAARRWCDRAVLFDQEVQSLGLSVMQEENVFFPLIPLTNPVRARGSVFSLPLAMSTQPQELRIIESLTSTGAARPATTMNISPIQGVSPVLPCDLAPISYLRSQGGELFDSLACSSYFRSLGFIDINNLLKGRSNLSFKYVLNGRYCGFLLAYEGRLEGGIGLERLDQSPVVYLAEFVADGERAPACAARLTGAFIDAYKRAYLDKGILMPIYTEARESTSYRLIQDHLARITSKLNLSYHLHIASSRRVGNDRMYCCLITPQVNDGNTIGDTDL